MQKKKNGAVQKKQGDTAVGIIEKRYDVNFGVRPNMKLKTLLKKKGFPSFVKFLSGTRG